LSIFLGRQKGGVTNALNNSNKGCESYHLVSYVNKKKLLQTFGILKKREHRGGGGGIFGARKETQKRSDFHYKENPDLNSKRHMNDLLSILGMDWGWGGGDEGLRMRFLELFE
jgi:hypothetical protein